MKVGAVAVDMEQSGRGERRDAVTQSVVSPAVAMPGVPRELVLALAALATVLTVTVIPAPFLIDDVNYLASFAGLATATPSDASVDEMVPGDIKTARLFGERIAGVVRRHN